MGWDLSDEEIKKMAMEVTLYYESKQYLLDSINQYMKDKDIKDELQEAVMSIWRTSMYDYTEISKEVAQNPSLSDQVKRKLILKFCDEHRY